MCVTSVHHFNFLFHHQDIPLKQETICATILIDYKHQSNSCVNKCVCRASSGFHQEKEKPDFSEC